MYIYDDYSDSLAFGNFMTRKFGEIYESAESFVNDYKDNGLPVTITEESATTLFYLLYAKYGSSNISNMDETQFKYRLFSLVFMHGPEWERRLRLQESLRTMTDDELAYGTRTLYNQSNNPSQPIFEMDENNQVVNTGIDTDIELPTINSQNSTKVRRGKVESYAILTSLLDDAGTEAFVDRFRTLFLQVVQPYRPLWYTTPIEEDDNE